MLLRQPQADVGAPREATACVDKRANNTTSRKMTAEENEAHERAPSRSEGSTDDLHPVDGEGVLLHRLMALDAILSVARDGALTPDYRVSDILSMTLGDIHERALPPDGRSALRLRWMGAVETMPALRDEMLPGVLYTEGKNLTSDDTLQTPRAAYLRAPASRYLKFAGMVRSASENSRLSYVSGMGMIARAQKGHTHEWIRLRSWM
jgi:hypothetical protein